MDIYNKLETLKEEIKKLEKVAIAFSGGVDSTFLLKIAHDLLGENVLAITARSSTYPIRELNEAIKFTKQNCMKHTIIESEELDVEGFADNPINRCYLCKKELFNKMIEETKKEGIKFILEGSNIDDLGDFRPGRHAIEELNICSPLKKAGLTKNEIRILSKELGLNTWDKQAFACLSSRFPYGEKITIERLQMIDKSEQLLLDMGFKQVRVRFHDKVARIEVGEDEIEKFIDKERRDFIYNNIKSFGFSYVSLDLKGYRTGSMNEVIDVKKHL